MMAFSIVYACLTGRGGNVLPAALDGAQKAVTITIALAGGYMFFCGLMQIAKSMHFEKILQKILNPLLRLLMPSTIEEESRGAVALNMSMNMLGIGNAATPAGIEAMRRMTEERKLNATVGHDMEMFLILNATSLQLIPTTVLTMRIAVGSANANAIVLPTLLCTLASTVSGALAGACCRKWLEKRHA